MHTPFSRYTAKYSPCQSFDERILAHVHVQNSIRASSPETHLVENLLHLSLLFLVLRAARNASDEATTVLL